MKFFMLLYIQFKKNKNIDKSFNAVCYSKKIKIKRNWHITETIYFNIMKYHYHVKIYSY